MRTNATVNSSHDGLPIIFTWKLYCTHFFLAVTLADYPFFVFPQGYCGGGRGADLQG